MTLVFMSSMTPFCPEDLTYGWIIPNPLGVVDILKGSPPICPSIIVRRLSGSQRFYEIQIFLRALRPGKPGRLRGTFCFEACYQVWISLKTFDMLEPNLRRFRIQSQSRQCRRLRAGWPCSRQ